MKEYKENIVEEYLQKLSNINEYQPTKVRILP